MTRLRYILASLWHYRRVHLTVLAGVATATAVITGALLVGDSVRGSLRELVLERLGQIDQVLIAQHPFREALASELHADQAAPLLLVPATLVAPQADQSRRATQLSAIGHTGAFWQLDDRPPPIPLTANQVALSPAIAEELQVTAGDEVLLHVPLAKSLPSDSLLGEKSETTTSRRLQVAVVLPEVGLARFSLRPSQQPPRNVFLPLATLQKMLALPQRANAVAIAGEVRSLHPTLDDFGIHATSARQPPHAPYLQITADRLVLPPALSAAANPAQPIITYLANTIRLGERQIPYSTITGVDSLPVLGPLLQADGTPLLLADDEIILNAWAAHDLGAQPGDRLTLTYYQPETIHGVLREAEPLTLTLRTIVPLENPLVADPTLTPNLPGVTDQRSMGDWDLPFPLIEPIRKQDEAYWDEHSTTPKAFVSYALAKKRWATRWGTDSVLRIPASSKLSPQESIDQLQQRLDPQTLGMTLLPVRSQGLAAARGTTAFAGLFLGFSCFLVASAVMLILLLFGLGAESRASELGLLTAVGWSASRQRTVWLAEASVVALLGAWVGALLGIGYARLMLYGLSHGWQAGAPLLTLHAPPASLLLGFGLGVLVALGTLAWSLRQFARLPAQQLLAGAVADPHTPLALRRWLPPTLLLLALGVAALGLWLAGEAQAGAFLGSGSLVLAAALTWLWHQLHQATGAPPTQLTLTGLATRNTRRAPTRSLLSIGLTAVASFLIVALSAFRLAPTEQGTGGFQLMATSDQPIHFDLNTHTGRDQLGFSPAANRCLGGTTLFGFPVQAGEDASCLNLYQTSQPEVVAIPERFFRAARFGWSAIAPFAKPELSPWHLLQTDLGLDDAGRPVVPVVLDKNTALYSLHLAGLGARLTVRDASDQPATLQIVGLLSNSVLQGKLLVGQPHFRRLFPDNSGERLFLLRQAPLQPNSRLANAPPTASPAALPNDLALLLETQLEDYGLDAVSTQQRLAGFLAVQNTYLATFQALGALGLLLGTVGLAVAQLRSVVQRRSELALLRSAGFSNRRLVQLLLGENTVLLLAGLGIGTLASTVAVLPHSLLAQANVPLQALWAMLAAVLVAGLLASWLAVRAALRAPLLPALRGD